ncbi:hypothetical protein CK203_001431 [Vitis vinifera]|uniref:Reverse transcriptase zinc-binding domain-containing protein n=1 Tax=Vitis vinifera TaxID=29760 RepID=A0A438KLR8_VITVI|nr:hypothetical protein CK203_001431 [Vitis vinifera]
MSMSKNVWVSEVWNPFGDGDGWTLLFARAFNDWEIHLVERLLQKIHAFRVQREEEDRVIWTTSNDVKATLLGWNGGFVGKRHKRVWQMAPLCIFWGSLVESFFSCKFCRLDRLLVRKGGVYTPCILRGHQFVVFPLFD